MTAIYINYFGYYQNCRGLRTKVYNYCNYNTTCFNYILKALTETWLNYNFHRSEFGLINYNIYRCNRSSLISSKEMGGNVLIAVRKDIPSSLVNNPDHRISNNYLSILNWVL